LPRSSFGSVVRQVREWTLVVGVAVLIAIVVRTFLLQQFYISGPSMEPTMYQDNRVLVDKVSYRFRDPRAGEVVVFDRITMNGDEVQHDDLIKRIIGLPGDQVEIKNCRIFVNDEVLAETYLDVPASDGYVECALGDMSATVVAVDEYFVMGDNRAESFDSRAFGTVKRDDLRGRAFAIIWPLDLFRLL
jgi:signal peptidase I